MCDCIDISVPIAHFNHVLKEKVVKLIRVRQTSTDYTAYLKCNPLVNPSIRGLSEAQSESLIRLTRAATYRDHKRIDDDGDNNGKISIDSRTEAFKADTGVGGLHWIWYISKRTSDTYRT